MKPILNRVGLSLVEMMVGMGVGGVAVLGTMQMMDISMKSNRGVQAKVDFTNLTGMIGQLVTSKDVCKKVLGGQAFNPMLTVAQPITIKNPANAASILVSTQTNPYAPSVKVKSLTLTKTADEGTPGDYVAQLTINAEKDKNTLGSKELNNQIFLKVKVDTATNTITECAGSGDFVSRDYFEQRLAEAGSGGGGSSCFETTGADCGPDATLQTSYKRYTCTYSKVYSDQLVTQTIQDSLTPCPSFLYITYGSSSGNPYNRYMDRTITEATVKICCK